MKGLLAVSLVLALGLQSSTIDPTGTWRAIFVGPTADRPQMVSEMIFDFKMVGGELTGEAHMGVWPGDAPMSDATLDGNKISFAINGHLPWSGTSSNTSVTGYPKLTFVGRLQGDKIMLSLNWGSIDTGVINGQPITNVERRAERDLPMEGTRITR